MNEVRRVLRKSGEEDAQLPTESMEERAVDRTRPGRDGDGPRVCGIPDDGGTPWAPVAAPAVKHRPLAELAASLFFPFVPRQTRNVHRPSC